MRELFEYSRVLRLLAKEITAEIIQVYVFYEDYSSSNSSTHTASWQTVDITRAFPHNVDEPLTGNNLFENSVFLFQ